MQKNIEPLNSVAWFRRIEMIANGELASTENALRHALHLLQLSPHEFRPREYQPIDEESFEGLLEAGELDSAARRLVAAPSLTVSSTENADGVEVAIRCRDLGRTLFGRGDSVAAAILQVWATCLLSLRSEPGMLNQVSAR